jgi:hypothetical protein
MSKQNRREHVRYDPDKNSLVQIFLDDNPDDSLIGLLLDKSKSGCGAIFHDQTFPFEEGETVKLKPGKVSPRHAEIVWVRTINEKAIRAGFEYE